MGNPSLHLAACGAGDLGPMPLSGKGEDGVRAKGAWRPVTWRAGTEHGGGDNLPDQVTNGLPVRGPARLWGVVHTNRSRLEAGQGDSAVPPSGVEGIWTLVSGGPRKVVAIETE